MRIAQIAPLIERVPPKKYGGTERMIHALTEELVMRGHEVTLFASGDSMTSAKLVSAFPQGLREANVIDVYGCNVFTQMSIGLAYQSQDQFDIIHDHTSQIGLPTANIAKTPTVMTLHGALNENYIKLFRSLRNPYLVTISEAQSLPAPDLNYVGMVYNGLNMENYPFSDEPEDYLLFVGRISMEKGVHFAIEAAKILDKRLIIAAKLEEPDVPYYKKYVEHSLTETIKWIGEVDETERNNLMKKAKVFLHPITWPEPFGLTLIESMTCGCPVVAFRDGSIPEIIDHGRTGFVVDNTEEMVEAIKKIDIINRNDCREHSLKNFNVKKMTDGYEAIYRKILENYDKK